jgi:uncharacterized protein (TIGR02246 family)
MNLMPVPLLAVLLAALAVPASAQTPQDAADDALKTELVGIERAIWNAWATKDEDYYFAHMTRDVVVIIIGQGMLAGRDTVVEEISASPCVMLGFDFSRERVRPLAADVALLTYEARQQASCAGHALPAHLQVSSIYQREADGWKMTYYQETPVAD